jgi:hypothetical protein
MIKPIFFRSKAQKAVESEAPVNKNPQSDDQEEVKDDIARDIPICAKSWIHRFTLPLDNRLLNFKLLLKKS